MKAAWVRLRWWIVAALSVGVAPLVLAGVHPLRDVVTAHGGVDSTLQVAYLEHALRHVPWSSAFWNLPIFWPTPFATVMMDPMLGPAMLLRLLWWPAGVWPALDANLVFVFTLATSFAMTALWARRLGLLASAAALAGVVYALGPYAVGHWQHLNQLPSPWLPLAWMACGELRDGRHPWRWALVAAAAAIVQLLSSVYLFTALAVGLVVVVVTSAPGSRPRWGAVMLMATLIALAVWGWSWPFHRASEVVPGYQRVAADTGPFQARLFDLKWAPQSHLLEWPRHVWTRPALYPGVLWSLLATLGVWSWWRQRRRRVVVQGVTLAAVGLLLAFGRTHPGPHGMEIALPFAWLQDHISALQAIRDPSRFFVLTHLALALGGAVAAERYLLRRKRMWWLLALTLLDLAPGRAERVRVAPTRATSEMLQWLHTRPVPATWTLATLPCVESEEDLRDARATLFAVLGDVPTIGGATGFVPPKVRIWRRQLCRLPLEERARGLGEVGAKWLVVPSQLSSSELGPPRWQNDEWKVFALHEAPRGRP